jgi:hypothetical protein
MASKSDLSSSSSPDALRMQAGSFGMREAKSTSRRETRTCAVEQSNDRVRAIEVRRNGGQLEVAAVAERDPSEVVAAGLSPAILVIAREVAVVTTTDLATDDEAELRSMARLALARETATEGVETLGDFQVESRNAEGARAILAAVPAATVASMRETVGIPVKRATVRALGTLALLRTAPELRRGLVLAVDATATSVELAAARDGMLLASRGLSIPSEESSPLAVRDEILPAVRMMLGSLRAAEPSATVALSRVLVFGSHAIFEAISAELARVTGAPVARLESHPSITLSALDASTREAFLASCWPLAGALLEDEAALRRDGSAIDFLAPTGLIDVAARTRQRVLLVAGVVVVAALAGWTLGSREWRALEARRDDLESKARNALPELRRAKRDELRLKHVDAREKLAPDWLAHLDILRRFAPDPQVVVLDGMTAQFSGSEIEYGKNGTFDATPELRFVVDGEAKDRGVADALRDALVREKGYTLGSTGADARGGRRLPAPFAYTLRTSELVPAAAKDSTSSPNAGGASQPSSSGASGGKTSTQPNQGSNAEAKP